MVLNGVKPVHSFNTSDYTILRLEVQRWRDILAVPYANYKSMTLPS